MFRLSQIRTVMNLPTDLVPGIALAMLCRYCVFLREYLEIITYQGKQVYHVVACAMHKAVQVMNNPADIINAAIENLLNEHCGLSAFSTLDRMARRIRTLVNGGVCQRIPIRISESVRAALACLRVPLLLITGKGANWLCVIKEEPRGESRRE